MLGKEITVPLVGQKIAGICWNEGQGLPILALHGWLDNAASFSLLAPLLSHHVLAVDLPGHGLSDHESPGKHFILLI